jgi:hypothetical protein
VTQCLKSPRPFLGKAKHTLERVGAPSFVTDLPQVMKMALSLHEKALQVAGTRVEIQHAACATLGQMALSSQASKGGWGYRLPHTLSHDSHGALRGT